MNTSMNRWLTRTRTHMMNITSMLTVHQTRLETPTLISINIPGCDTLIRTCRTCIIRINISDPIGCRFCDSSGATALKVNKVGIPSHGGFGAPLQFHGNNEVAHPVGFLGREFPGPDIDLN